MYCVLLLDKWMAGWIFLDLKEAYLSAVGRTLGKQLIRDK
jgi:hypothetical protein